MSKRDALSESRHSASTGAKTIAKQAHLRKPQHDSYETTQLFKHVPSLPTRCFFKISIDNLYIGDIVMELFGNEVPKTCENFRTLCTGEAGVSRLSDRPLHYENTIFHRVIAGFMIQGGDFTAHNGTGGESIWGVKFPDESFKRKHDVPYLLSMANCGPNTNGSQFFITCAPCPHLDDHHVVFGRVIQGQDIVRQIEEQASDSNDRPIRQCKITESGELVPQISTSAGGDGRSTLDAASISRRSSRYDAGTTSRRRSRSSSSSGSSTSSSSNDSTTARALRKSRKERKRLERKLAKKLDKEKRRLLKKLKKKIKSKKHAKKAKRSPSSSSSTSDDSSLNERKKKKRKHKKAEKKSRDAIEIKPEEKPQVESQPAPPKYYCTIDPAEIPPVPEPKFLRRRATPPAREPQPASRGDLASTSAEVEDGQLSDKNHGSRNYAAHDRNDSARRFDRRHLKPKHQSGGDRKSHKGRGDFFYGRGTPDRWHQAERRLTKLPGASPAHASQDDEADDKVTSSRRSRERTHDSPYERRRNELRDKSNEQQREQRRGSRRSRSHGSTSSSEYEHRRRRSRQERPREAGKVLRRRSSRSRSIGEMSSSSSRDTAYSGRSSANKPRRTLQSVIIPIDN